MAASVARPIGNDLDHKVTHQLDRILASATFRHADRLRKFLQYIVAEVISGRQEELKEYSVALEVFDKQTTFDPRFDPIVRVQARRLRVMLERYYIEEGSRDDVILELPKGGYVPAFRLRESVPAKSAPPAPVINSDAIAVVPFSDLSAERDLDCFCEGLRQEVVDALCKLPDLRILACTASPLSNNSGLGGARLSPGMLINGSVRRSGRRIRVTIQLLDQSSGCYLWSATAEGQVRDTLSLQKQVAQSVLRRLRARSDRPAADAQPRRPSANLTARNLYVRGRYLLNERTEEGMLKARDLFEKAAAEDSQFGLAHSGIADTYCLLGHYGVLAPAEVWSKAAAYATKGMLLDNSSVEVRTTFAHVKSAQEWDWVGAEREFRQAISMDPSYATAHHWYAMSCLAPLGRLDEALNEILLAQSLDPVSPIISRDVAVIYYNRREFELALEQCDQTIELNPHFPAAFWILGLIQEQRKDYQEAKAAFQRASHLTSDSPRKRAALSHLYAVSGQRKLCLETLHELEQLRSHRYVSPFDLASIHFALGQNDTAFEWLDRACHDRCFELLTINVDPRFDAMRSDPRFDAVARKLGLRRTQ